MRNAYTISVKKSEGGLGVGGRIILKWIFEK
jgi:hypothetical protein